MSTASITPFPVGRRHLVATCALALLGSSGCGGGDDDDDASTAGHATGATSRPARTARPCGTQSGTGCASPGSRRANDFTAAATALASLTGAWNTCQNGQVPPLLKAEMARVLALLDTLVDGQVVADTRDEAIALARVIVDLRLRYQPIAEIEQLRLDLWMAQVEVDAAESAFGDIRGDAASAALVFDRFEHTLSTSLAGDVAAKLSQLSAAAEADDAVAAALVANQIRAALGVGWK